MKNLLEKSLELSEIKNIFEEGYKKESDFKIGIEYERLPVLEDMCTAVPYDNFSGMCELLTTIAEDYHWDFIKDNESIIGLKKHHDTITLEPGCQFELSIEPQKSIEKLRDKINNFDEVLSPMLDEFGLKLLNYGVSPISTYKNIKILPKRRYFIMAMYLWGILSDVMMRETAGIQACFDFTSEEDAMKKFRIANMLVPFVTAMFANSPIRGGVDTGYKSFRALAWLNTDSERCGFASKFERNFDFEDYINAVLNTPMIYISKSENLIPINGSITFKDFINKGYDGYTATLDDFKLHANMYFPDVRLRKFIEIRNHDCVGRDLQYSILALYKGLLYNSDALSAIDEFLSSKFKYNDISELRFNVPKLALDCDIKNYSVKDIANEILNIAYDSLKAMNEGEEEFLLPIKELTAKGITPADIILKNWYGSWNKNPKQLIDYVCL